MNNTEIRLAARGTGVPLWQVADYIGVSEATLTRLLRKPVDESTKKRLLDAIKNIKEDKQ